MNEIIKYNPTESEPNYTTELSKQAENILFDKIIDKANDFGVEINPLNLDKNYLLEIIRKNIPERLNHVNSKIPSNIENASIKEILDKVLNIDKIIKFDNKNIFIDITTAKASAIINKLRKIDINYINGILQKIGCDHFIVLRIKKDDQTITDDKVLNIFTQLENLKTFSSVIDLTNPQPTISNRYFTKNKTDDRNQHPTT